MHLTLLMNPDKIKSSLAPKISRPKYSQVLSLCILAPVKISIVASANLSERRKTFAAYYSGTAVDEGWFGRSSLYPFLTKSSKPRQLNSRSIFPSLSYTKNCGCIVRGYKSINHINWLYHSPKRIVSNWK